MVGWKLNISWTFFSMNYTIPKFDHLFKMDCPKLCKFQ